MKRLVQLLLVAAWIVGAVLGDLPQRSSASGAEDASMHLLVETERAQLGVEKSRVVLTVETPWHSQWRVTAPLPEILTPDPVTEPSSRSETAAPSPVCPSLIRSFVPLP
jgi:hypothetical protein